MTQNYIGDETLVRYKIRTATNPYIHNEEIIGLPFSLRQILSSPINYLIPKNKGLYHLFNAYGDLMYIGISNNINRRLKEHDKEQTIEDCFVLWFCPEITMQQLYTLEAKMINKIKPPLNTRSI